MAKPIHSAPLIQQPGVADYFNSQPLKTHNILIVLAPDILILARCEGAPATARYFSQRLNQKVTEKMIKTIKAKAAKGEIVVTREELEVAAMAHPVSAVRMRREPSLCDPLHYRSPADSSKAGSSAPQSRRKTAKARIEKHERTNQGLSNPLTNPTPDFCESDHIPDFCDALTPEITANAGMNGTKPTAEFRSKKLSPGKIGPATHRIVQILAAQPSIEQEELEAAFLKTIPAKQRAEWNPENHKGCSPLVNTIAFAKVHLRKGGYALPAPPKGRDDGIHLTSKGITMAKNHKPYHDGFLKVISRGEW